MMASFLRRLRFLPRRLIVSAVVVAAVLLVVRLCLPVVISRAINARLQRIEGYSGRIAGVDLQLFRGAYQLNGVEIFKTVGGRPDPLLAVREIDFSLAWRELFHGRVVSDIVLTAPRLRVTASSAPSYAAKDTGSWQDAIRDIFPIEIMHLQIIDGELRYLDETAKPRVDLTLDRLEVVATGLRNRATEENGPLPAHLYARARTVGEGDVTLYMAGDLLAASPRFNLKLDVVDVQLKALNDFLSAYAGVDVSAGVLKLYAEAAGQDGGFEGYVKPFFEHLEFKSLDDENKNLARRLWEKIVAGAAAIVKNEKKQQVATRIPFSGRFGRTDVGVWATIGGLFRNGFVQALREGRESDPPAAPKP